MKKILLSFLLLFSFIAFAQEKKVDSKKDFQSENFKLAALPFYSYGKGLGMTSADSLFHLNIRFRMQNRVTYYNYDKNESDYEAKIRRLRLRLDGFVGNPKFQYALQLSFAPEDVGALKDGGNINIIRDATVAYRANKHWSFIFGQTKLPGNRQRVNSSGALQLTDRTINNAKFNIDRDFGFQAYYLNNDKDKFSWNIKTAVSSGNGRNWTKKDKTVALTGKVEIFPFGTFKKGGDYFEGDILREPEPKLMLSGVYHFNKGASREFGQQGKSLDERVDLSSMFFDAMFKYNGWAAMVSYMSRDVHNKAFKVIPNKAMVFAGNGMDFQASYIFPSNFEIIGRHSFQKVHKELFKILPNQQQTSLGFTKYIWEHAFKIQTEISYDQFKFKDGLHKNDWYVRFQIEIGI